jgi:hypothetical protein
MGGAVKWVDENVFGNEPEEKEDPKEAVKQIDPNTGEYGGRAGLADEYANRYSGTSQDFLKSAGDFYGQGAEDRRYAYQARGDQNAVLQMQLDRARGNAPSVADMQAQRDMQRVMAGQQSLGASARGPGALALAQTNAAAGAAAGQANVSGQAQLNSIQERERAEQAAAQTAGQMRGQDLTGQQLSYGAAGQQNQASLGFAGLANSVRQSQQQGGVDRAALQTGQYNAAQARNAQGRSEGNQRRTGLGMGFLGAISQGAGTVAGQPSDARAKRGISPLSTEDLMIETPDKTLAKSTWGTGAGMSESATDEYMRSVEDAGKAVDTRVEQYNADRAKADQALAANSGPLAVAGANGPGQFTRPDNALQRIDDERRMELRARREHGMDLDDREATEERVLNRRSGEERRETPPEAAQAKAAEKRSGIASALGGLGSEFSQTSRAMLRGGGGGGYAAYMPQPKSDAFSKVGVMPMSQDMNPGATIGNEAANRNPSSALIGGGRGLGGMNVNSGWSKMLSMRPPGSDVRSKTSVEPMVSDMRGKLGVDDMFSDMSTKLPAYSDTRTKEEQRALGKAEGMLAAMKGNLARGPSAGRPQERTAEDQRMLDRADDMKSAMQANMDRGPSVGRSEPAWLRQYMDDERVASAPSPMFSDDRTKLAAAWDQGHAAGVENVMRNAQRSPDELRSREGTPAADAARSSLARGWDEGAAAGRKQERGRSAATEAAGAVQDAADKALERRDGPFGVNQAILDATAPQSPRRIAEPTSRSEAIRASVARARETAASMPPPVSSNERVAMFERDNPDALRRARLMQPDVVKTSPTGEPVYSDERAKKVISGEQRMADANRAQEGYSYAYKDEFRPPDQAPGEQNVGPMAQEMAADPTARTAVKEDGETGLLTLDRDKMLKLHGAGLASVQKQLDEIYRVIGRGKSR